MIDGNRHGAISCIGARSASAAAALLLLCLPYPADAQGGFQGPGQYEILNAQSRKVLDLDQNDPSRVIQRARQGTESQIWEIQAAGDRFYFMRNLMTGNALEAVGTRNSTPVMATPFDGRPSQQWRFDAAAEGAALIVSRSGKTLDIPGGTAADGAAVQIYDRNGESNQRFLFQQAAVGSSKGADSGSLRRGAGGYANPAAGTGRTQMKPGWNMFSPQQDVEVGQQVSQDADRQLPLLNDPRVDSYLNTLGRRLAAHAPGYKFPYAYRAVNDRAINAFALPGGPIYINRGVIDAADNEAHLAAVMAHETSHVALRHGTNQASKASAAQMPLAILGGMLGGSSTSAALAQLGAAFAVNSVLLKYSRAAESQADIMGAQILYDSGYDPRAMAQFFEKIQAQDGGGQPVAFFSSHPSPERRSERVNEEAALLAAPRGSSSDSREFDQIKRYVQSLSAPRRRGPAQPLQGEPGGPAEAGHPAQRPEWPSSRFVSMENSLLSISYPDNWKVNGQGDAVTITPNGGLVEDGNRNQALAYGVIVNFFEPPAASRYAQGLQGPGYGQETASLEENTDRLIQEFRLSNRNMRVVRPREAIGVGRERGLSAYLSNDSPLPNGGRETNWLVTLPRPEGLIFLVFTAPERDFQDYEGAFQQMLYSVRLKR
jgi:hypothetical protein